jgi:undecaprenyl-diphosphatase
MSALEAIVLGIVQGMTEFLPISSTGHLLFVPEVLGWDDPGSAFTAITQIGTLAAVLIYFRSDISRILRAWVPSLTDAERRNDPDARLGWYIAIGTIPILILGFIFRNQIETAARSLTLVAITLIVLGLVLLLAEKLATHARPLEAINRRDAIVIGLAQAAALVPGVSRSGATLTAGLFLGLRREDAARYSFLLSIPSVLASGLYEIYELISGSAAVQVGAGPVILATIMAFISGYLTIAVLLKFLQTHTTMPFVIYRVAVGSGLLILIGAGAIG